MRIMPASIKIGGFLPLQQTNLYFNTETPTLSKKEKHEILLEGRELRKRTDKLFDKVEFLLKEQNTRKEELTEIRKSVILISKRMDSSPSNEKDWLESLKKLIDEICAFVEEVMSKMGKGN